MSGIHKASRRQEARVANRFGGTPTPGSGNQWDRKNDVRTPRFSFELKTTGKKQYTLKASELEEGEKQALIDGREFAFGIEMNGRNWITISEDDFATLLSDQDGLIAALASILADKQQLITTVEALRTERGQGTRANPPGSKPFERQVGELNAFDMVLRILKGESVDGS